MLATTNQVSNKLVQVDSKLTTTHVPNNATGLSIRNMDDLARVSQMLASSNFFTDAKDAAQCGVKVLAGLEMGIGAFQSMTGIHIIKGKPSVGAGLISAKIKSSGKYDYETLQHDDKICSLLFYETDFKSDIKNLKRKFLRGEISSDAYDKALNILSLGISTFTIEDARKAGTQNLEKFPRNMLFARAISNGQKWYCPDVFSCSVYTPEELGANVDEDGYIISEYTEPSKPVQPLDQKQPDTGDREKQELMQRILVIMKDKQLGKGDVQPIMKQRYNGKETRDQLTLDELRDFNNFLAGYEKPSEDAEVIPFE